MFTFTHCRQRLKRHEWACRETASETRHQRLGAHEHEMQALTVRRKERLLLWSSNLWSFGKGMLGPLFAVFAQRVGGNILDITWAWAIYLGMTGILTIVAGVSPIAFGNGADARGCLSRAMRSMPCARLDIFL